MDTRDEEFMLLSAIQTEDNIAAEDTIYNSLLSAAAFLIGAENAHQAQISRRYQTRNFVDHNFCQIHTLGPLASTLP